MRCGGVGFLTSLFWWFVWYAVVGWLGLVGIIWFGGFAGTVVFWMFGGVCIIVCLGKVVSWFAFLVGWHDILLLGVCVGSLFWVLAVVWWCRFWWVWLWSGFPGISVLVVGECTVDAVVARYFGCLLWF